jgi:hypothetical protein
MAASHPHMFQQSVVDESKILKLVENHFLPDRLMLQWQPTAGEDIPTPNTKEIVVFSSFFQQGFRLPACDFLRGLLQHYQIELVHLNIPTQSWKSSFLSTSVTPSLVFLLIFCCLKTTSS